MKTYKTLPDGTEIVEYEDSLAPAVAEMWNRSGEGWGGSFGGGVWTADQVMAKRASRVFFNIFVAMKDGEAIGYCSFDRYDKDENTAYVHVLNVRPDYHGKKIGKELVLMCVKETIALGMPRLDIHTWPGNTKSVPLYKKCGFLWEDRTDTTHLCNYIPTVLSTALFGGFFEGADWYGDSTRKIEIKPDGVKTDKFELFGYEWEKNGRRLRVGFEKTGRRIYLVETDDYKIEMAAENHELAFGLDYLCRFHIFNKTGKGLDVEITTKSDGVIGFEHSWAETVEHETVLESKFTVGAVAGELDPERMHPCLLADVRVNGAHAEFGLGIEPKYPVTVSLADKRAAAMPGTTGDVYLNIKNNLPRGATVRFSIPENPVMSFEQTAFEVQMSRGKDVMAPVRAVVKECGYAGIPVKYEIVMDNAERVSFTHPLHLVSQGLYGQFAFETERHYGAANGLWRLRLNKMNNRASFDRILPSGYGEFPVSMLGEPYSEENKLAKPADVRVGQCGAFTTLEADYPSADFDGAVLSEIFEFDAAGTLRRRQRVANNGPKPLELSIKTEFWTSVGKRPVFHYDGDFHETADDLCSGFESVVQDKIDENWIFEASAENPAGVCWPKQYKPRVHWGEDLHFTIPAGKLAPGQSFTTEPIIYMCGVFKDYREFRNYALGIDDGAVPFAHNHLETIANGGNIVLSAGVADLTVKNNRLVVREGAFKVSSPDGLFADGQIQNPAGELRGEALFSVNTLPGTTGVRFADFTLDCALFRKDIRRALLVTDSTVIETSQVGGVFTVANGGLGFSVAPGSSDAVYSLTYNGGEWFYSRYPALEPYSWWNPFVGGQKSYLERLNNSLVLREKITASFTEETDSKGNLWTGIRADVTIETNDEYRGMRYAQYYLTIPGVPAMCHFMRIYNGTGRFIDAGMYSMLFLSGKEGLTDMSAHFTAPDKTGYDLSFGKEDFEMRFDKLLSISRSGKEPRAEKLYVYKDHIRDRGRQMLGFDLNIAYCDFNMKGHVADGASHTTKPVFCIITDKELTMDSLADLDRIEFK